MTVFSPKKFAAINVVIDTLFERAVLYHQTPELTSEDIYNGLVKPKDRKALADIETMVEKLGIYGVSQSHQQLETTLPLPSGDTASVTINMLTPIKRLLPGYASKGFHGELPEDTSIAINKWLAKRQEIGGKFKKLSMLVDHLNDKLSTPAQMKFYFNGIVALLELTEEGKQTADRIRESKVPGKLPSLSREVRDACIEATKTVSMALLFPVEPKPASGAEVTFSIGKTGCGYMQMPWKPNDYHGNPHKHTVW